MQNLSPAMLCATTICGHEQPCHGRTWLACSVHCCFSAGAGERRPCLLVAGRKCRWGLVQYPERPETCPGRLGAGPWSPLTQNVKLVGFVHFSVFVQCFLPRMLFFGTETAGGAVCIRSSFVSYAFMVFRRGNDFASCYFGLGTRIQTDG